MKRLLLGLCCLTASYSQAQIATHVVISEVYGGGGNGGSIYRNDYIELYNPTATPIALTGWSVQYAATGGSSWQVTNLNGTIQPFSFYLVQEAVGANLTAVLPTPDATGAIPMAGTAGKVALVSSTTALTGACPTTNVIDFLGFGPATTCSETTPTALLSNSTSAERKASATSNATSLGAGGTEEFAGNGWDAGNNSTDFVVPSAPNPQNSASPTESPSGPVNNVTVSAGAAPAEPATNGTFTINLSSAAPVGGVTVTYTLTGTATVNTDYTNVQAGTITIPQAATAATVNINIIDDATSEAAETIILSLQSASAGYTFSATTATISIADDEVTTTPLHTIQGNGATATAGNFTAEAIVTAVYPSLSPAGFYMQEEDADADSDPNTSEGIFVVSATAVAVGDKVRVTGPVQENAATPSFSQAVFSSATVTILANNSTLPAITDITLPVSAVSDFEHYEGMLVRFPTTLTVTNNFTLGRFGEVGLSAGGLVYQPTQIIDPNDASPSGTTSTGTSNLAAINAMTTANALRSILLDDGINTTLVLPYADPADHTLRIGSTTDNLTGIMGYAFSTYRVQPIPATPPTFTYAPRPTLPSVGSANLKVAGFNMLNYWNGNGVGGGFPTDRGADSQPEFTRQRNKLISSITQINADVVGLIELENDGTGANSAIQDIVNGVNAILGPGTYSIINDGATIQNFTAGVGDVIRCGIIYKSSAVTPVGAVMISPKVGLSDTFNRPPIAQTFNAISSNTTFNFVVNHFKSKSCTSASGGDLDLNDGQACYNERRKAQAVGLISFLNNTVIPSSGTDRIVSVGDYNAYYEEDPMDILRAANYKVLSNSSTYSYQFDGQIGSLDHAVVSNSLSSAVTGVAKWNVNAAEPVYLDYNDLVDDGGDDFSNPFASYYTTSPFRSSDHDPVLIGLNLSIPLPVTLKSFEATKSNDKATITWATISEINCSEFVIERSADGNEWVSIARTSAKGTKDIAANYTVVDNEPATGTNLYRLKTVDLNHSFSYSAIRKLHFGVTSEVQLFPNPATDVLNIVTTTDALTSWNLEVSNAMSQSLIRHQEITAKGAYQLDISGLSQGIYFLKISWKDVQVINKIFIKR